MSYQTILFDFDGVLCKGKFYEKTLVPDYNEIYDWIQSNIFGDKELVKKWMRSQTKASSINQLISENTGIEFAMLSRLFEESVRQMELEKDILQLARDIKSSGKKIAIVTDNMEVFSQITVPYNKLDHLFDVIINSAEHGCLKKDINGELFDTALMELRENAGDCLLIDDSAVNVEKFRQKGGQGFVYRSAADLKLFLQLR